MEGKYVSGIDTGGRRISGIVTLVYTDALASGINEYTPVTYVTVADNNGELHTMYPRDIQTMCNAVDHYKKQIFMLRETIEGFVDSFSTNNRGDMKLTDRQNDAYEDALVTILTWKKPSEFNKD